MTPQRLKQRRRILNARAISERIAAADHAAAQLASADAAMLASRLAHEVALSAGGAGATTGAMLAARAALADRLLGAVVCVIAREAALNASETLTGQRRTAARMARRSAETLVEQAESAVAVASDRRMALPPRRLQDRRT